QSKIRPSSGPAGRDRSAPPYWRRWLSDRARRRSAPPIAAPVRHRAGPFPASLVRPVAGDLHPAHQPAERPGIVYREVLDRAVVPERHRAVPPAEAAGEFGPVAMVEQIVEQGPALRLGHALEAHRVGAVYEEELAPGLGMR